MKNSLSHLPENKRQEILEVVEIIQNAVLEADKIILFGSYAVGDWVEDSYVENGVKYEYISDYDFLIITNEDANKPYELTEKILARTRKKFNTPVSPIIHSIDYVNRGLEKGQYFFTEIVNHGILLYDTGKTKFTNPIKLSPTEQKEVAVNYFNLWFPRALSSLEGAVFYFSKGYLNDAAFTLHQATERLYNTVLLVFTGYKPKTHNLDKLRTYIKPISQSLFAIFPFPEKDDDQNRLFELLKRAYIDARYKDDYDISSQDFKTLVEKIERMKGIVERICEQRIAAIENL